VDPKLLAVRDNMALASDAGDVKCKLLLRFSKASQQRDASDVVAFIFPRALCSDLIRDFASVDSPAKTCVRIADAAMTRDRREKGKP
jgi:hypothetical protein